MSIYILNPEQLEADALRAANQTMVEAVGFIDDKFGKGYARKHPVMIAGFMQAAAGFYHANLMAQKLDDLVAELRAITGNAEVGLDNDTLQAVGASLGIEARPGESWGSYRLRVYARLGEV